MLPCQMKACCAAWHDQVRCGTASCRCSPTPASRSRTIARLVGHTGGSLVTETIYRKQIRPVLVEGAEALDRIFDAYVAGPPSLG